VNRDIPSNIEIENCFYFNHRTHEPSGIPLTSIVTKLYECKSVTALALQLDIAKFGRCNCFVDKRGEHCCQKIWMHCYRKRNVVFYRSFENNRSSALSTTNGKDHTTHRYAIARIFSERNGLAKAGNTVTRIIHYAVRTSRNLPQYESFMRRGLPSITKSCHITVIAQDKTSRNKLFITYNSKRK
jgi:hypothetical protein